MFRKREQVLQIFKPPHELVPRIPVSSLTYMTPPEDVEIVVSIPITGLDHASTNADRLSSGVLTQASGSSTLVTRSERADEQ